MSRSAATLRTNTSGRASTADVLATAVSFDLPGAAPVPIDDEHVVTESVVAAGFSGGVAAQVWSAIDAGVLQGPEDVVEAACHAFVTALHATLFAEETALLTLEVLDTAGVETRALKGLAIAYLDHPDPAGRTFGDADILIRRGDYARALGALGAAGFPRDLPPVRVGWERRFGKSIVMRASNGGELDLHLAITGGYFGARIDHDELWAATPGEFELAGRTVRTLDREGRLLHACCHSVLGGLSGLRTKRDVAHLVLVAGADWQKVIACATRQGIDLVVAEAARTAWNDLRLDPSHPFAAWAANHRADQAQQRALASYRSPQVTGWGEEGMGMLPTLGPLDRVRFLAGLAVPSRASMRARGRTWRGQCSRAGAAVRSRVRRGAR